ncbi:TMEM164 family acyltransferase [Metamycoplasma equirhinis]|uniref:TMEM164 family acyltransferase n=1 Tax=Metamycoplasma equirhinis TaxID=92402 RepID=UPI003593E2D6
MYKFIEGLSKEWKIWERPTSYGWFHLIFIFFTIILATLMIIFIKKDNNQELKTWKLKTIIGSIFFVLLLIEIFKQLLAIGHNDSVKHKWVYDIYKNHSYFPYVLCSTALYIMPIYLLVPKGKVSDGILTYIGIYSLWMGGFVIFYPGDVFTKNIFICFHSMIYHSLLFALGLFLTIRFIVKFHWKSFLYAGIIFIVLYLFAIIGNEIIYQLEQKSKLKWSWGINLFNMSHRKPNPMVSDIAFLAKAKPWVITISYIPFTFIGVGAFWSLISGIGYLVKFIEKKYKLRQQNKNINTQESKI